jgi:hypothetical protein
MKWRIIFIAVAFGSTLSVAKTSLAGDAGCGLGNIVMQKNTKLSQTLAVTTNATLFSQLLGITFGTSGCSASGFVQTKQDAIMYAEANLNSLRVDLARGEGEGVLALSSLMGCPTSYSPMFAEKARAQYHDLFGSGVGPTQFVDAVDAMIKSDANLSLGCTGLI